MRRASLITLLAFASPLLCSCSEGGASGSVTPAVVEVLGTPSDILVALPDGRLVVQVDASLAIVDPRDPAAEPMVVGPASDIGEVFAAAPDGEAVLVLAEGGSFVLRGASWVPSPFSSELADPVRGAVRLDTATGAGLGELWVLTSSSLYRVSDGIAEPFLVEGDLTSAQLAAVRRPEGPALWVLLADRLLEVWRDRAGVLRSASIGLEVLPTAIAGDASGQGWMIIDGTLHSFGTDRRLLDGGASVERLVSDALSSEVWAVGEKVWVGGPDGLFEAEGLTLDPAGALSVGADGSLFASVDGTVQRYNPRRDVSVIGPEDGALLGGSVDVSVIAPGEPTIEAELDGNQVDVTSGVLRIEPMEIGDGTHTLLVRVRYDDGTLPTEDRRVFEVVTDATWSEDVEPLYTQYCADCHAEEGSANTRLHTREIWTDEALSGQILLNVRDGRMPLGRAPLSQREVALIEAWMVNGFAP
ncbi:MAG: cytochrome c [Sandaracinaceae bacterium]